MDNMNGGFNPNGNANGGFNPNNNVNGGFNTNNNMNGGYNPNGNLNNGYNPVSFNQNNMNNMNGINGSFVPNGMNSFGQMQPRGSAGLGIASMVLGILGVIMCWIPWFPVISGLVGLILGGIAISKKNRGRGMAITGLVLSIINVAWYLILALLAISGALTNAYFNISL